MWSGYLLSSFLHVPFFPLQLFSLSFAFPYSLNSLLMHKHIPMMTFGFG